MYRISFIFMAVIIFAGYGCKKEETVKPVEKVEKVTLAKKYAKYKVSVYKDKDLKNWLATLEKTESVDLMAEEKYVNPKKVEVEISRVKLSDNKEGFIKSEHLADKPVVFTDETTKAYDRPDMGSKVSCNIPKGTIGFVVEEKADWTKIYIGKIGDKKVYGNWVKGGFDKDDKLVSDAREFWTAIDIIESKTDAPEAIEKNKKEAKEKLEPLAKGTSIFSALSQKKLDEINGKGGADQPPAEKQPEKPAGQ
jgi:lipoprotein LenA